MNLYNIAAEYHQLAAKLIDSDLDDQTKADTLESIGGDLEAKITNIGYVIRQLESEAIMAKDEAKRIAELAKVRENACNRLKEWLLIGMVESGKDEVKTPAFTVKLKSNPPSVVINNEELVPIEFIREKLTVEPNKQAIALALKSGQQVAGCHLESKQSVSIK